MKKQIRIVSILIIIASLFSSISLTKANASESNLKTYSQQTSTIITVPMTVECDKLSAKAMAYAIKHDLCPSTGSGGIAPQGIAVGNCGAAWLDITNMGAGIAQFNMGATSSQGAIVIVSYSTSWVNWNAGRGGVISGTDYLFSTSWARTRVASTGAGYVTATMSGQVTLYWGGICGFLNPSASAFIN